jgi:hypothetical protein
MTQEALAELEVIYLPGTAKLLVERVGPFRQ